jgi:peptidoglycan/LPS O-acetylase OafA/YrhL
MNISATLPSSTKKHFEILDGLRGIAALAVVIFHFMEMFIPNPQNPITHAYLAVDFFFCLSGFVIAYAYDDRMLKMSIGQFFKARLIRLHPLVVLGAVLGLMAFVFDPFGNQWQAYHIGQLALLFLASILLIPFPIIAERAFNNFGLNAPAWTLFWEYIANILYALLLHKLKRGVILMLTILAAASLIYVAKSAGNVSGGWSKDNFWHGAARVGFSFLAGMCVFRFQLFIKNKFGFALFAILLGLAFFIPFIDQYNWLTEPALVIFYFPLIIALGAGSNNKKSSSIAKFSGDISYPLYITHYFVLWSFLNYYEKVQPSNQTLLWVIPMLILMQIAVAYLALKLYDLPLRSWLRKHLH